MLINEVCKECNLTKKAVEYYTEQGLIQPRIKENGYRQFSETDALKLKRIAVLRGLGFSVPEIRTILENDRRTAIYDVLNRKEFEIVELQTKQALIKQLAESGDWEHIEGQVEALQNKQSILNRILNLFEMVHCVPPCDIEKGRSFCSAPWIISSLLVFRSNLQEDKAADDKGYQYDSHDGFRFH